LAFLKKHAEPPPVRSAPLKSRGKIGSGNGPVRATGGYAFILSFFSN
jgi:hypothetical protein